MKSRRKYEESGLKNDLDWLDADQELVHEQDDYEYSEATVTLRESLSRGFRSILAIIICIVIPALYYFDWSPSVMANETSEFVTGLFEGESPAPVAPIIQEPGVGTVVSSLDMSMADYAAQLNEEGILEEFSSPAVRAFYENNVTVDYLLILRDAGLIEQFSFPAVIAFYQNEVTIDYLNRLNESDLLSQSSFPAIVAYFQNGVTIEFLNELKERDLLDTLSFPDIVNMYQAEQNP